MGSKDPCPHLVSRQQSFKTKTCGFDSHYDPGAMTPYAYREIEVVPPYFFISFCRLRRSSSEDEALLENGERPGGRGPGPGEARGPQPLKEPKKPELS